MVVLFSFQVCPLRDGKRPTFRRTPRQVQHLWISDYHQRCVNTPGSPIGNELEIRSLRYFVAAAEELNFTRAAARLFVAQQALSREIKRLETRTGTTLFVRTTRRVTLTPDGERLLVLARDLVARHDARLGGCPRAARAADRRRPHERGTAHGDPDPRLWRAATRRRSTSAVATPVGPALRSIDSRPAAWMSSSGGSTGSGLAPCRPWSTFSSASSRWRSSYPPDIRWPSTPPSRCAACRDSRSMACRRTRTRPNGPTSSSSSSPCPERTRHRRTCRRSASRKPGYHLVRQGLPILASADHVAGARRRPSAVGGPGPALRVVDGVAARIGGGGDGGAPRCRSRARGPGGLAEGSPRSGGGDTWLPEPEASRLVRQ